MAAGSSVAGATEAPPESGVSVAAGPEASTDDVADGRLVASRTPCWLPARNGFPRIRAKTAATTTATPMPAGTRPFRRRRTAGGVAAAAVNVATGAGEAVALARTVSTAGIAAAATGTAAAGDATTGVVAAMTSAAGTAPVAAAIGTAVAATAAAAPTAAGTSGT